MDKAPSEFKEFAQCLDFYGCGRRSVLARACRGVLGAAVPRGACKPLSLIIPPTPPLWLVHGRLRFARCRDKQKAFEAAFPIVEGPGK